MRRVFLVFFLAVCLSSGASGAAEFIGSGAAAELPISVKILDFKTTQKLCGSARPPAWCPAHLLRDHSEKEDEKGGFADDGLPGVYSSGSMVEVHYSAVFE